LEGYDMAFPGKREEAELMEQSRYLDEYWDWSPMA
jgi:hypothetical protein